MSDPASSIILENGERLVHSWKGNEQTKTEVVEKSGRRYKTTDVKQYQGGVLVLTSHRLVWLERHGTFSKSYDASFDISLTDIRGLSMGGSIFKHITITDSKGPHVFHLEVGDKQFPFFRQMIEFQMAQRRQSLEQQRKQERVHVMVDFSFLKQYMEKGGLMIQTVKCSNCAGPIQLPSVGDSLTCNHCGRVQHVEDIFEKVKQLIG